MKSIKEPIKAADWYLVREIVGDIFWVNEPGHVSFYVFRSNNKGLMIDSGLGLTTKIGKGLLKFLGITELVVYCTHSHCDHIGLNHLAKKVIIGRREWEKYIEQNESDQLRHYYNLLKSEKEWPRGEIELHNTNLWSPSEFISEGDRFEFGRWKFQTLEVPGHTCDSVIFYEEVNNLLFLGDLIYSGTLYFHFRDSNFSKYEKSLDKLLQFINSCQGNVSLWPAHNQIPLAPPFLKDVKEVISAIKSRVIEPASSWPKDEMFEEGLRFSKNDVKIVLRKDEYANIRKD